MSKDGKRLIKAANEALAMTRAGRIEETLEKISRLYELVDEMRGVVGRLREVGVEVRIRSDGLNDPFTSFAALTVTLRPGCETDPK